MSDEAKAPPGILGAASAAAREALRTIGEAAGEGATVGGVTLVVLLGDESFVYPLSSSPSDDQLAGFSPFDRDVMARTLRALADRWQAPTPAGRVERDHA